MTPKERAITKLRLEINKDIDLIVKMVSSGGLLELLSFIYTLHISRVTQMFSEVNPKEKDSLNKYFNLHEDSIKYLISLIIKFGHLQMATNKSDGTPFLNSELIDALIKTSNYINSKYEAESTFQLFDVEVSGERDQNVKVDTSSVKTNPDVGKLFYYFLRVDEDNDITKNSITEKEQLIQNFKDEYLPFSDLFEIELGVTVDEYCWLLDQLLLMITDCYKTKENLLPRLSNGNVDEKNFATFLHFAQCFLKDKDALYNSFENKYHSVLDKLTFKPNEFNERQLRFHQVTRQPILRKDKIIVLSPQLILDSIFTNVHYSLIESSQTKQVYIKRQSTLFLNKVAKIASKYGYKEIDREKDLYEGKNQIGDIDLVLKNEKGHFLLIEAKNHALPLDVFFKDVEKTKEHLKYLQTEWEKKVLKRNDHLKTHHSKYSIDSNYSYIVVSRFPEIISHYSTLFILSTQEFEIWLNKFPSIDSFELFHKSHYENREARFTDEHFEELKKANLVFGQFKKE